METGKIIQDQLVRKGRFLWKEPFIEVLVKRVYIKGLGYKGSLEAGKFVNLNWLSQKA